MSSVQWVITILLGSFLGSVAVSWFLNRRTHSLHKEYRALIQEAELHLNDILNMEDELLRAAAEKIDEQPEEPERTEHPDPH